MRIRKEGIETRNIFEENDHLETSVVKMWRTQRNCLVWGKIKNIHFYVNIPIKHNLTLKDRLPK